MNAYSNPAAYWESRLSAHFDLTGTGYAALGPHYNRRMYQARLRALEKALVATGRMLTGSRVLEVGCGSGFYTEYCARQGVADYIGVDLTSISVARLQPRYPQFRFVQADIAQPQFDLGAGFDVALAADVLFHIIDDEAFGAAIKNIVSRLKRGGLFIASDIFPDTTTQTAPHCRSRSHADYRAHFSRWGMRVLHVEPIFAILQPPPIVPNAAWPWRAYARLWHYGWRLACRMPLDRLLPSLLDWLDRHVFLHRWGSRAPNNKWLLAIKDNGA